MQDPKSLIAIEEANLRKKCAAKELLNQPAPHACLAHVARQQSLSLREAATKLASTKRCFKWVSMGEPNGMFRWDLPLVNGESPGGYDDWTLQLPAVAGFFTQPAVCSHMGCQQKQASLLMANCWILRSSSFNSIHGWSWTCHSTSVNLEIT